MTGSYTYEEIIQIFPVPFRNYIQVEVAQGVIDENEKLELWICDILGRTVERNKNIQKATMRLETSEWNTGLFIYKLIGDRGIIKSGKMIKE